MKKFIIFRINNCFQVKSWKRKELQMKNSCTKSHMRERPEINLSSFSGVSEQVSKTVFVLKRWKKKKPFYLVEISRHWGITRIKKLLVKKQGRRHTASVIKSESRLFLVNN